MLQTTTTTICDLCGDELKPEFPSLKMSGADHHFCWSCCNSIAEYRRANFEHPVPAPAPVKPPTEEDANYHF